HDVETLLVERAGDLAAQPEAREHAVRVLVGAPADMGDDAGRGRGAEDARAHPYQGGQRGVRVVGVEQNLHLTRRFGRVHVAEQLCAPRREFGPQRGEPTGPPGGGELARRVDVDTQHRGPHAGDTNAPHVPVRPIRPVSAGIIERVAMHHDSAPSGAPRTGVAPGVTPRLLRTIDGVEDLDAYRADGGYRALARTDALLSEVSASGLRGRGGAGFPAAIKLSGVRAAARAGSPTVAVANGEEGEPASVKDRWLMRRRPHLVLDGLRLAAAVAGARRAVVYLSDTESARSVDRALTELDSAGLVEVPIELAVVDPGYVAGEETAAVRAISGGPARPTDKPPRPFECGVDGLPTLVSNVETLANLPWIHANGGAAFR